MAMNNPYPKNSRLYKIKQNKSTMAAIQRQSSQLATDYSNSQSAFSSIAAAEPSVAHNQFEVDTDGKLKSLHSAAHNIRIALPSMRQQARSNAVTYQRLKNRNRDLDGQSVMFGSDVANDPAASEKSSMMSSLKSANSKAADAKWNRIRYGL